MNLEKISIATVGDSNVKLYFDNTSIALTLNDQSNRTRSLMGDDSLTLLFDLSKYIDIPVGAFCYYPEGSNNVYTLERPQNFKKDHSRAFGYTLLLEGEQAKLKRYKFRDTGSRKLKFSLTAQPREHLEMLVDNLNDRDSGWVVGDCIEATEKVLSYNHTGCLDALNMMAEEFNTEWEIIGKVIHLRKVEHNRDNPLPLSYGRGMGLKGGMDRSNISDTKAVEKLFVQGGERNIDLSRYGNGELLLPKGGELGFDGTYFEDEEGYDAFKAKIYKADEYGYSLQLKDVPLKTTVEDSLDLSNIYPSRVGEVTEVIPVGEFYDFRDATIPEDLDYSEWRIDGEKITVIFQSGMLAGKEFDVEQTDTRVNGYIHSERRFKLVSQEIDGIMMPGGVFVPAVGDKYAVFGMMMPDQYVADDNSKSGAEWDMFREAVRYMWDHENPRFSFRADMDGIWAKQNWLNVGGKIVIGGYVLFSDPQFLPDGLPIRIVTVKEFINNPQSPTIELSNSPAPQYVSSSLNKIEENEVIVDDNYRGAISFTKRRFRDAKETMDLLQKSLLNFSEGINPITVQTMQMLVGDESLQFRFVNNNTDPQPIDYRITYDKEIKKLHAPAGILQHMTLGIDSISSSHKPSDYRFWDMDEFNSPALTETEKAYYLYARVLKEGVTGEFYLSETAIPMDKGDGYYYFLAVLLNSELEEDRSLATIYGFTEILPGRITTDKIVSSNGHNFIDLVNNAFRIGNSDSSLEWNTNENEQQLLIKNADVDIVSNQFILRDTEGDYILKAIADGKRVSMKHADMDDVKMGGFYIGDNPGGGNMFTYSNDEGDVIQFMPQMFMSTPTGQMNVVAYFKTPTLNSLNRALYVNGTTELYGDLIMNGNLTMSGTVNMPGLVMAGRVTSNGELESKWGRYEIIVEKEGLGLYKLRHGLRNTNYFFTGTTVGSNASDRKIQPVIMEKMDTYITIGMVNTYNNNFYDADFEFMIAGTNRVI